MEKEKFLELLTGELKRLEEVEHISDLANNGRYEEVDVVLAEIDYSLLNEYMKSKERKKIDIDDIPEQYVLTFAIYLSGSKYDEADIMRHWEDLADALEECGSIGEALANALYNWNINCFDTFAELIKVGEDESCEEEFAEDEYDEDEYDEDEEDEEF